MVRVSQSTDAEIESKIVRTFPGPTRDTPSTLPLNDLGRNQDGFEWSGRDRLTAKLGGLAMAVCTESLSVRKSSGVAPEDNLALKLKASDAFQKQEYADAQGGYGFPGEEHGFRHTCRRFPENGGEDGMALLLSDGEPAMTARYNSLREVSVSRSTSDLNERKIVQETNRGRTE
ncbi:uncharacterized protein N7482_004900 [Penicillium canariense]|uniref:Uncharacterized protein n=1 Tax=Penicillium canariense TaxID=189055 RepID=A0A9W9LLP5_9EURO|nr:uncharacterized protein N7482_004900 [Penicillium canariense]KAJ5166119.1 hypothetical protein N7482_004900 [Penicillium canariense]